MEDNLYVFFLIGLNLMEFLVLFIGKLFNCTLNKIKIKETGATPHLH